MPAGTVEYDGEIGLRFAGVSAGVQPATDSQELLVPKIEGIDLESTGTTNLLTAATDILLVQVILRVTTGGTITTNPKAKVEVDGVQATGTIDMGAIGSVDDIAYLMGAPGKGIFVNSGEIIRLNVTTAAVLSGGGLIVSAYPIGIAL